MLKINCLTKTLINQSKSRGITFNATIARFISIGVTSQNQQAKSLDSLPGFKSHPFIGNLLSITKDKNYDHSKLHKSWQYLEAKYGPMVRIKLPKMNLLLLFHPDDFKAVLEATKDDPKKNLLQSLKAARLELPEFRNKTGILIEDGEEWWRVRRQVQTPLMKPKLVSSYVDSVDDITKEFIQRIDKMIDKNNEVPENFADEVKKWGSETIGAVVLNRRLGNFDHTGSLSEPSLPDLVDQIFFNLNHLEFKSRLWKIFPSKQYRNLKKAHESFLRKVDAEIRLATQDIMDKPKGCTPSILEIFLNSPNLTYTDVMTIILDVLFAGLENVQSSIGLSLYLLAKHPEVQKKLQREIKEVLGAKKDVTQTDINKMNYLVCFVKEMFRLFPVSAGVVRIANEDMTLRGYRIPKGQQIMLAPYVSLRKPEFFPKPLEFIPERWMRDRPLGPIHPYASISFGIGTRMCIGKRIFDLQIYIFLIRILQKYNVSYNYEDFDLKVQFSFIPAQPYKFTFTNRDK